METCESWAYFWFVCLQLLLTPASLLSALPGSFSCVLKQKSRGKEQISLLDQSASENSSPVQFSNENRDFFFVKKVLFTAGKIVYLYEVQSHFGAEPFRRYLSQLYHRVLLVQRNCQVRGIGGEIKQDFYLLFPTGRNLLKCQDSTAGS